MKAGPKLFHSILIAAAFCSGLFPALGADLFDKLGFTKPGGSVKDLLPSSVAALPEDQVHVTSKALGGLFKMIAEEEKRIRENPAARTTEILGKIFGAAKKQS